MPELPEIVCRAREIKAELVGRTIEAVEVAQPKCLNVPVDEFEEVLSGGEIRNATNRGKWIFVETSRGHLLINMGMGGEIVLAPRGELPEKWRVRFDLSGGESLWINFWWFGYAHYVAPGRLGDHQMTAELGPNALDVSIEAFRSLLNGRRGRAKSFLLNQKRIAGIGNAYVHDILFRARLHPLRTIPTLSDADVTALYKAIRTELARSIEKGAAFYELDLHGVPGGFSTDDLLVGYREGEPCPECGATIEKLKTGSTSSFICPRCQPLPRG